MSFDCFDSQPSRLMYSFHSSTKLPNAEALNYSIGKTLGSGTYAKVKAAWCPRRNRMVALKIINKKVASKDYLTKFLPREIRILQRIRHENILRILEIVETEKQAFFVLEMAENGDLLDYINSRRALPEPEARCIFTQIARAVQHCHSLGIIHRDLKCENILLTKDMDIRIGDFGFSLDLAESASKTPCGSYSYAAPELFTSNGHPYDGKKADVWSIGVILYAMVCGRLPFGDDNQVRKSAVRNVTFSSHQYPSQCCKIFIKSLLNTNVAERLPSSELTLYGWATDPVQPPIPLLPRHTARYTVQNCLPFLSNSLSRTSDSQRRASGATITGATTAGPSSSRHGTVTSYHTTIRADSGTTATASSKHKPFVSKLGKKIADAVKHVGYHKVPPSFSGQ